MADLQVSIDAELNRAAWVISGYLLAYAVSMTFMGRLSDLYGRRAAYLLCLAIFVVGSAAVALAPTLNAVVAGRVVQAFGAGALVPISMALVGDLFPPEKRALPLGSVGAVGTAGWVRGHLYGGVLGQFAAWPHSCWFGGLVVLWVCRVRGCGLG